jgi:hypothetical protein
VSQIQDALPLLLVLWSGRRGEKADEVQLRPLSRCCLALLVC